MPKVIYSLATTVRQNFINIMTMWMLQLVSIVSAFATVSHAFVAAPKPTATSSTSSTTILFPHQFNGGYDPAMTVTWNPLQAAEFVLWHRGAPQDAGMQLAPMIPHWSGTDVGEFLTRIYLGEINSDQRKVSYESKNVRTPRWRGLGEEGVQDLHSLLIKALPNNVLTPAELARCGQAFLLNHHRWPKHKASSSAQKIEFEDDTFASRGHSKDIAQVLGAIRQARIGFFSPSEVVSMVVLPENAEKEKGYLQLTDYFGNLGITLTSADTVTVVEGMARGGWGPANIAHFMGEITTEDEVEEEIQQHPGRRTYTLSPKDVTTKDVTTTGSSEESSPVAENVPEIAFPTTSVVATVGKYPWNSIPQPNAGRPWSLF
jgi:hypothetical protein